MFARVEQCSDVGVTDCDRQRPFVAQRDPRLVVDFEQSLHRDQPSLVRALGLACDPDDGHSALGRRCQNLVPTHH